MQGFQHDTPERLQEEVQHLRKLSFRALKYFSIISESYSELQKRCEADEPSERERVLKSYYRKLMKRFHPDMRRWLGFGAAAPSLEHVRHAYESGDLHWLVWADLEYGIAPLAACEQTALLEKTIADFAYAIRRTRLACRTLERTAQGYSQWMAAA